MQDEKLNTKENSKEILDNLERENKLLKSELKDLKTELKDVREDFKEYCRVGISGAKEDSEKVATAVASILQAAEMAKTAQTTAQGLESMANEAGQAAKKVATIAGGAEIAAGDLWRSP